MASVEPITAAGGVVFRNVDDDIQVLLIYRLGVWDLPKGKLEDEETIRECAVREVAEEIGITEQPHIVDQLTDTYHEYEREGKRYGKITHWFAMQLASESSNDFKPQVEEDIHKVVWVPLDKAQKSVGYENLKKVLVSFSELHQSL